MNTEDEFYIGPFEFEPHTVNFDNLEYYGDQMGDDCIVNARLNLKICELKTKSGQPAEISLGSSAKNENEGFFLPYPFAHYRDQVELEEEGE